VCAVVGVNSCDKQQQLQLNSNASLHRPRSGTSYLAGICLTQCTQTQTVARRPGPHEIQYSRYTSPRSAPAPAQSDQNTLRRRQIGARRARTAASQKTAGSKADNTWQQRICHAGDSNLDKRPSAVTSYTTSCTNIDESFLAESHINQ